MTEVEQVLVAALNEQRLITEALEQRIVALEGKEQIRHAFEAPQEVIEFMEKLAGVIDGIERRQDDLEQVVERRGLGTSWSPSRDVLMKIIEADERRLG
ncbi:hypothetical protein [Bosea sp. UC22_33]|uniref:hypothetical protein n=1 Tax=Bosea sp. UC22_33 TaxID=3350165 RepID=UPI00366EAE3C